MKRRHITPYVQAALRDTPVVFLQGPRQAGKTTLLQSLKEDGHDAAYFTFDDAAVLAAAQGDADGFVANLPTKSFSTRCNACLTSSARSSAASIPTASLAAFS
jgi:predicted ATPase